jgi:hypothetical protein
MELEMVNPELIADELKVNNHEYLRRYYYMTSPARLYLQRKADAD